MATDNTPTPSDSASASDSDSPSGSANAEGSGVDNTTTTDSDSDTDTPQAVHERFGGLVARLADSPDETGGYPVRGVALGEGDVTLGLSEKRTHWPAEVMQAADSNGKLGSAKLLKGSGGDGHKPIDALASPDNIIGSVDLSYQPGVGIVYEGTVIDERMARLIDHELVEVSPDMFRELGEYDDESDAYDAAEILGVPYLTVVDRGAVPSNSIESSADRTAVEALSYGDLSELFTPETDTDSANDDAPTPDVEQLAVSVGDAVRWRSEAGGDTEPAELRYGVVVDGLQDDAENRVLVAVYQPTADGDGWEPRNEQNPMNQDNLETVGSDGVDSLPPVSQIGEQGGEGKSDTDTDTDTDSDTANANASDEADTADTPADAGVEQLAPDVAIHEPTYSSTSDGSAGFADGEWGRPNQSDFDTDELGEIADHFIASSTGFPPESYGDLMFPVVAPDGTLYLPALRAASQRLPQSDGVSDDEASRIQNIIDDLADTAFDAEFGDSDSEQGADTNANNDQSTHEDTDMSTTDDTPADTDSPNSAELDALKEQLSEVEDERDDLAEKVDELEAENDQLSETNEQLEADTEPVREILADRLADGSMLTADTVAERYELGEMYDMLAEAEAPEPEPEPDADEQLASRKAVLSEQLAAPRGQHEPTNDPGEESAEETNAEHDERAHSALGVSHILDAEQLGMSPAEYTREQLGVDPAEHSDEYALRSAINAAEGGDN